MRLLGASNTGELGLQYVSTYQPISDAPGMEYRVADVGYLSAKYASVATADLRWPLYKTGHMDVGEILEHKHE